MSVALDRRTTARGRHRDIEAALSTRQKTERNVLPPVPGDRHGRDNPPAITRDPLFLWCFLDALGEGVARS
jgi:hypothetical protein